VTGEVLDEAGQDDGGRRIRGALEAVLMVADEPVQSRALARATGENADEVDLLLRELAGEYAEQGRGFELREVGGGWRFYVREEFDPIVRDFVLTQNPTKLSQAALETLAVIAYKQPITRGAIAQIRAVNVDSVVRTLLGRGLITESFTDAETGAINYETTELLLTHLGVNSLDDLPLISPLLPDGAGGFDDVR
jgi:segregation and condensation protein B